MDGHGDIIHQVRLFSLHIKYQAKWIEEGFGIKAAPKRETIAESRVYRIGTKTVFCTYSDIHTFMHCWIQM